MGAQSRWSRNAAQVPTTQVHLRPHNVAPHPTLALLSLGIREQVALVVASHNQVLATYSVLAFTL